jgi:hypothetical protein
MFVLFDLIYQVLEPRVFTEGPPTPSEKCGNEYMCIALTLALAAIPAGSQQPPKLYNTVIQKLPEGKQVFSWTQSKFDMKEYCEKAPHYDYGWFEMQQHARIQRRRGHDCSLSVRRGHPDDPPPGRAGVPYSARQRFGRARRIIPTLDYVERAREAGGRNGRCRGDTIGVV